MSPETSLTGNDGWTNAVLHTTGGEIGVATVTVTATVDNTALELSGNVEFTEFVGTGPSDPVIALAILDSDCETPQPSQSAGSPLCLRATLSQDGDGLAGEVVSFSAGIGTLRQETALTNNLGIAEVLLDSTSTIVGAATATVSFGAISDSANYEFVPPQSNRVLSLNSYTGENCNIEASSFTAGTTFCLIAKLTQSSAPVKGEIIDFTVPIGTLQQNTALTDEDGFAQVKVESNSETLGAATARADFGTVSDTTNYELVADDGSTPTNTPEIILTGKNEQGDTVVRFSADETLQLEAELTDENGVLLKDHIITFNAERGSLNSPSALTGDDGKAQVTLSATQLDLGAAVATASAEVNGSTIIKRMNYEITESGSVDVVATGLGYFKDDGTFVPDEIGLSLEQNADKNFYLSAGGTMGLSVTVVGVGNTPITTPIPVTFSSACHNSGTANLDTTVTTINGTALATYEDVSCATANGNQDVIVATITVNSVNLTATTTVNLLPERVGSISFISAQPENIVLRGTGGQGKQETSTLTFSVNGELGNPLAQQEVTFNLDTDVGGLILDPQTSLTNSQGQVTTRVTAGNVPTAVRVTASTQSQGKEVRTQSDLLSVNTGLPDQNSMSLSATTFNPETDNINGVSVEIVAFMADSFNNPVPDGTTISFTTEGGQIVGDCNTTNGNCRVNWTSANPRPIDNRVTVLATAIGHETFFDTNGDNIFDSNDGGPIADNLDNGFGRSGFYPNGFIDHGEAFRDENENGQWDSGEFFADFNLDGKWNGPDGKFNGPQCQNSIYCVDEAAGESTKINVRKALVLALASSEQPKFTLTRTDMGTIPLNDNLSYVGGNFVTLTNDPNVTADTQDSSITLQEGQSLVFRLALSDNVNQTLPAGATVNINPSVGSVLGQVNTVIGNKLGASRPPKRNPDGSLDLTVVTAAEFGGDIIEFELINNFDPAVLGDTTVTGTVRINIAMPESLNSYNNISFTVTMIGS